MGVGNIIKIVAVLVAVVAGLWSDFPEAALIIAILGLVAGYFVDAEDRQRFLVATIALSVAGVAAGANAIPTVGPIITDVMRSLGALYAAGAITCILLTLYEKLKP